MRLLDIDIETAPALVYTFSLFKPMIGMEQIVEHPRIICFSAKWHGSKKVMFYSEHHDGRKEMLDQLHALLDEADAIVTYNGKRFDQPWITGELLLEGYWPPSPFARIDLYQVMRSTTRFISGKLDYAVQRLLGQRKVAHQGFSLWKDCLAGDDKAWATMKKYAVQDTALLEPLYDVLRPWIKNHPNVALHNGVEAGCTNCGSDDFQRRGFKATGAQLYQQYRCNKCGHWFRGKSAVGSTEMRQA